MIIIIKKFIVIIKLKVLMVCFFLLDNKKDIDEEKLSKQMKKELSPFRAIIRIIIGFIAILIWILLGVNITVIFSSAIQSSMGFTLYFYRNPFYFLLVAFINILFGLIAYFVVGIVWWAGFHFLWSIRWFYGFFRYRKIR